MAWKGALVKKASDQTAANFSAPTIITFDTDVYDTDAWHDTSSNTSRLTVPSGVTKVRISAQFYFSSAASSTPCKSWILKNGIELVPGVYQADTIASTFTRRQILSYIDECTAGDYYEFQVDADDTSVTVEQEGTWFAIEEVAVPPIAYSGAVVKKAADQTTANYATISAIAFDAEVHDVGGWHDNVTNNSRMTVPSGVARVRLTAQVGVTLLDGSGDYFVLTIYKNGALMSSEPWAVRGTITAHTQTGFTYVDSCSAGDYYQAFLQIQGDTSVTIVADETWFAIEKVE